MTAADLFLLAFIALVAGYVQASAGFSFSIVFVSVVSSLGLMPLWELTELASFLVVVNAVMALASSSYRPDIKLIGPILLAMIPATAAGVLLLISLHADYTPIALMLLGAITVGASVMLFLNLKVLPTVSTLSSRLATGVAAGLLGGMLAAPGPPLVLSLYRQPRQAAIMRVSLLALLLGFGLARLFTVQLTNPTSLAGLSYFLLCAPASLLGAWLGTRHPPPLSDVNLRRCSFALLSAIGLLLLLEGYWQFAPNMGSQTAG